MLISHIADANKMKVLLQGCKNVHAGPLLQFRMAGNPSFDPLANEPSEKLSLLPYSSQSSMNLHPSASRGSPTRGKKWSCSRAQFY